MSFILGEPFVQSFFDANGDPLALGTIEFYITNTSTPTPIYSDSIGTSAGTSVTLNSLGAPENSGTAIALFFDDKVTYKIVRKDASGVEIGPTIDPYIVRDNIYTRSATGAVARTIQSKLDETVSITDFGASSSQTEAFNTAAIQSVIDSMGVSGGIVEVPNGFRGAVSSLTINENVYLVGQIYPGQDEGNDFTYETFWGCCLIVSGTITVADGAGIRRLGLISSAVSGYSVPTTDGEANTLVGTFSGVAITPSGTGCILEELMVLGFSGVTPVTPVGNRHMFDKVRFDCTNGITIGGGSDVSRVRDCHGWPYLTAELSLTGSVNYRSGIAFRVEGNSDRWSFQGCYAFGYETSYRVNGTSGNIALYNKFYDCSADSGNIGASGTSRGFYLNGYVGMTDLTLCQATNCDINIEINTVGADIGGGERLNVTDINQCLFSLPNVSFAKVTNGRVNFNLTNFFSGSTATSGIDWDSSDGGSLLGCHFEEMFTSSGSSVIAFASTASDNNVTRLANYQASTIHADNVFVDDKRSTDQVTTQDISGAGAIDLVSAITHIVTTSADAYTLADGYLQQRKVIIMQGDGGDATLTPANFANGTTITFNDVGNSCELIFTNGAWHLIGSQGVVLA